MPDNVTIPQPPLKPVIGNLAELDKANPVQSLVKLSQEYGPYFRMQILSNTIHVVSSQELVDELCDETRFTKQLHRPLQEIRAFAGDGLFTAYGSEPNWARAHAILMPAFGPIGVRDMFPQMLDIAEQMFTRWERFGDARIDVPDTMTRLTLDTIALAAFDYRFNSFYSDQLHPFVGSMVGALSESGLRARRPKVLTRLMMSTARRYDEDIALMQRVAGELITERRADPEGKAKDDLLGRMLNGRDPKTGEGLSDENIMNQMITFLIAGHETTSGLLSFATYFLLQNPDVLAEARRQVDAVLGDRVPTLDDMAQLRYLDQILMETLRLWPTAPAFARTPLEETLLGGKYPHKPGDIILVLIPSLHRDPAVWGADAEAFRPERFTQENAAKLPPNAWKPFGTGARACIGRPFAMQEAQLVLAMMLQRFDIRMDDPDYQLSVHETLTLKPENLRIRARARVSGASLQRGPASVTPKVTQPAPKREIPADATPLTVLYGSNTGSAEAFARRIADEAPVYGFAPRVATLDEAAGALPQDGALVVVTASYEGQPPDNAVRFVPWVESLQDGALDGLQFAVFGCGNRQWARTWQAIPTRVDTALSKAGASRVADRGEGDSGGDFFGAFDDWIAGLWSSLGAAFGKEPVEPASANALSVDFVDAGRPALLRLDELALGTVVENRELVNMAMPGARSKRHVEFALPEGMTYRAGDYLAVLARNPEDLVTRALRRFGLTHDTLITLHREGGSSLPLDRPVALGEVLAHYVELAQPASKAQVARLAALTRCPPEKAALEALAGDVYDTECLAKRTSVLDLLTRYASTPLELAEFLSMLPPMKARQYSISSSPLWKPDHVTLTLAVVDAPALSGVGQFHGVASTYLAGVQPGDRVAIAVRPSQPLFHPPVETETPIVMICAGSGLAPFRGFLQERALQKAQGLEVGEALLYFGTNHPQVDYLYEDELKAWEAQGVVNLRPVFTDQPVEGQTFVQHRLWAERAEITRLFDQGALFFTCGDGKYMAPAVRDTLVRIYREHTGQDGSGAEIWAEEMEHANGRYVADVFA